MLLTILVDNISGEGLEPEHGLSFLVETGAGSVLFDTGQTDAWFRNLEAIGKRASSIKAIAVSHGHYDHTGGLTRAMLEAPDAQCYAHPHCFIPKYSRSGSESRYIGMPAEVVAQQSVVTTNRLRTQLLPGVWLSGEVPARRELAISSRFTTGISDIRQDVFDDEQCMVLQSDSATAVLVGCAHRGLERACPIRS